jgi:hypothetical protein
MAVIINHHGDFYGPFDNEMEAGFFAQLRLGLGRGDFITRTLTMPTTDRALTLANMLAVAAVADPNAYHELREAKVLIAIDEEHHYVESFELPNENNGLVLPTIYPGVLFDPRDL